MANPLPHEAELYQKISDDKITVDPAIWDLMYHYLGDYISVIDIILSLSVEKNESISIDDARKILDYTRKIKATVDEIIKRNVNNNALHPIIMEFFMHYIGNDTHIINLCVSFYLDPLGPEPVPVDESRKLLKHTQSMRQFLDRLRVATTTTNSPPFGRG